MTLNREQQKAVHTTEGRILILAGAGSGKTSVLTHRIAYLIEKKQVAPETILGLTFTNKAAEEMRHRLAKFIPRNLAKQVTLCTFHSFCMNLLRKEIHHLGYTQKFSLYGEKEIRRLISQIARHLLEHEGDLPSLESTIAKLTFAKNKYSFSSEDQCRVEEPEQATWHDKFTQDIFERLQFCMRAYNAVDFDSLLSLVVQLFEEFPEVLARYQERFRYVMIDEYQDTNPIQYRLAALLCAKHNNLCVVGDDDQSIYGWRGAEIKHILQFRADILIKLEQNYRSTPTILAAANAVISHNQERHAKQLWSESERGDLITLFHAPTEVEEATSVVQRIIQLCKQKKLAWKDIAILYRSNSLSAPFEAALMQAVWEKDGQWIRGIPYQVFGGTELYERSEVKDLIAYLKAISNPLDQEALLRIINVPRRGISDQSLDLITQYNRKRDIPLYELLEKIASSSVDAADLIEQLSDRALKGVRSFVQIMNSAKEKFQSKALAPSLAWLLEEIDYKKAIQEEVKSDKMREFKWENVLQCQEALASYEEEMRLEGKESELSLHDFLQNTLLDKDKMPLKDKSFSENRVNLMTFHSAKGLEFSACFLVGLEDHIIPHEKSVSERGVEEERRLMYVAMTRAKQHLTLSMARKRKRMGKEANSNPSRFLFEIPKELIQVSLWQHT